MLTPCKKICNQPLCKKNRKCFLYENSIWTSKEKYYWEDGKYYKNKYFVPPSVSVLNKKSKSKSKSDYPKKGGTQY